MDQLSRSEILDTLQKRELYLPEAQTLPLEELQSIYKSFVVPQGRREPRPHLAPVPAPAPAAAPIVKCAVKRSNSAAAGVAAGAEMVQLMKRIKVVCVAVGDKRPAQSAAEDDRCLSSVTKRVKNDFN